MKIQGTPSSPPPPTQRLFAGRTSSPALQGAQDSFHPSATASSPASYAPNGGNGSSPTEAGGVLDALVKKGDSADLDWIDRYNTVFMLDDSHAMSDKDWSRIESTLTQLLPLAAAHDQDGIDVLFAARGTATRLKSTEDIGRFLQGLRKTSSNANISASMSHYIEQYANRMTDSHTDRSAGKPLNLIVLSSGEPNAQGMAALVATAQRLDRAGVAPKQLRVQVAMMTNDDTTQAGADRFNRQFATLHEIRDVAELAVITGKESVSELARKVLVGKLAPNSASTYANPKSAASP